MSVSKTNDKTSGKPEEVVISRPSDHDILVNKFNCPSVNDEVLEFISNEIGLVKTVVIEVSSTCVMTRAKDDGININRFDWNRLFLLTKTNDKTSGKPEEVVIRRPSDHDILVNKFNCPSVNDEVLVFISNEIGLVKTVVIEVSSTCVMTRAKDAGIHILRFDWNQLFLNTKISDTE